MTGAAVAGDNSWSGAYLGAHLGAGWGTVNVTDNANDGVPPGPFSYSVSSVLGGLTAGYNLQSGNIVYGVEGDVGYLSPTGSGIIGSAAADHHQDLTLGGGAYGDLTGRLGLAIDQTLLYAKGGVAFFNGQAQQATTNPGYAPTGTGTFTGWALGAGIESFVTDNVSLKAEYEHLGFGSQLGYQTDVSDTSSPIGYKFNNWTDLGFDTVKIGLNYHIN